MRGEYYVYSIGPDILSCHPRQTVLFATGQEGDSLTFCQLDRDNGKQVQKRIRGFDCRLGKTLCCLACRRAESLCWLEESLSSISWA